MAPQVGSEINSGFPHYGLILIPLVHSSYNLLPRTVLLLYPEWHLFKKVERERDRLQRIARLKFLFGVNLNVYI